jgi:hypothetical protein
MTINMTANSLLVVWVVAVGAAMRRLHSARGAARSRR